MENDLLRRYSHINGWVTPLCPTDADIMSSLEADFFFRNDTPQLSSQSGNNFL